MGRVLRSLLFSVLLLFLLGQLPVLAAQSGVNESKEVNFMAYQNEAYAFKLEVPADFLAVTRPDGEEGTSFITKDGTFEIRTWGERNDGSSADRLYEDTFKKLETLGEIAYQKKLSNGFMVAWWSGTDSLYLQAIVSANTIAYLVITCDEENIDKYNGLAAHCVRSFKLLEK